MTFGVFEVGRRHPQIPSTNSNNFQDFSVFDNGQPKSNPKVNPEVGNPEVTDQYWMVQTAFLGKFDSFCKRLYCAAAVPSETVLVYAPRSDVTDSCRTGC